MNASLRDQLLEAGFRSSRRQQSRKKPHKPRQHSTKSHASTKAEDMDLAKAYALRARVEAQERKQAQLAAQAKARARKEKQARLDKCVKEAALNKANADIRRHFEYGGKIRQIYVDAEQQQALNQGTLGIIQHCGRYFVVHKETLRTVQTFAPEHIALWLTVDTDATPADTEPAPTDNA